MIKIVRSVIFFCIWAGLIAIVCKTSNTILLTDNMKGTPKRHQGSSRAVICRGALRSALFLWDETCGCRIARRGGVKRMSDTVHTEMRNLLRNFVSELVQDAMVYTEYSRRRTMSAMDVVYALKHKGRMTLYGYDGPPAIPPVRCSTEKATTEELTVCRWIPQLTTTATMVSYGDDVATTTVPAVVLRTQWCPVEKQNTIGSPSSSRLHRCICGERRRRQHGHQEIPWT